LLFDGDDAGRKGMKESADRIREYYPVTTIECPDSYDPGSLPDKVLDKLLTVVKR
jgi:hypothetical protein